MNEEEQAKTYMYGVIAREMPEQLESIKARVEEMKTEFIARFEAMDTEEEKAVELTAFSLFALECEELVEKIK